MGHCRAYACVVRGVRNWRCYRVVAAVSAGHTPGPWRFELAIGPHGQKCYHTIKCNEYDYVASTWGKPHEANARLIAAAPELLAALKLMEKADDVHANCAECDPADAPESCEVCFPYFDAARVARRAAIAKAEGKAR